VDVNSWPIAARRRTTLSSLCGHTSTTWWTASPRPLRPLASPPKIGRQWVT